MPTIIFATDFSPVAQHAATYAAHLAYHLQKNLTLLHAYIVPFAYKDSAIPLLNDEEVRTIAEASIVAEQNRLQTLLPQLTVDVQTMPGDLINVLQEEIDQQNPDLVVLGTSGDGADSILWGSMAVKALRSFRIPILVIPSKATWHSVSKIGFAADYRKISEETPFSEIKEWVRKMNAALSVVHIDHSSEVNPLDPPTLLREGLKDCHPSYHSVGTDKIIDGVHHFVAQNEIDWLILVPRKYGFWASLFHKSRTRMLAQVSHIPILALHQD